jgi:hypothetical protein
LLRWLSLRKVRVYTTSLPLRFRITSDELRALPGSTILDKKETDEDIPAGFMRNICHRTTTLNLKSIEAGGELMSATTGDVAAAAGVGNVNV